MGQQKYKTKKRKKTGSTPVIENSQQISTRWKVVGRRLLNDTGGES